MRVALDRIPETRMIQPVGLITVRIDPDTGLLAGADHPNAIFESFRPGYLPLRGDSLGPGNSSDKRDIIPEPLF